MKVEKIDMSPEAITNRLKLMNQLWELSIKLSKSKKIKDKKVKKSQ
ncbi:hypothetical protein BH10ACI1_BH10ACI1_00200 [soil metagenome]